MKTLEQVVQAIHDKTTWERDSCAMLDNRDYERILTYLQPEQVIFCMGDITKDIDTNHWWDVKPFTEENIKAELKRDLAFAFEKAIDHRGISSCLMADVIRMWMWILDDELADYKRYDPYGMPFYEKVAVKYGLPNRGDDYVDDD